MKQQNDRTGKHLPRKQPRYIKSLPSEHFSST